jgi:hypothetical protein
MTAVRRVVRAESPGEQLLNKFILAPGLALDVVWPASTADSQRGWGYLSVLTLLQCVWCVTVVLAVGPVVVAAAIGLNQSA